MFTYSKEEIEDIINNDVNKLYPKVNRADDVYVEVVRVSDKIIELYLYQVQKLVRMDTIPSVQFINVYGA